MVAPFIDSELHGPLPVFPLPEFVLFPSVKTSLYVFEPRYRRLVEDCLDQDGYFCMAAYEQHPALNMGRESAFFQTGCLARLVDYQKLDDGCYTIVVEGIARVDMQEVEGVHGYRQVLAQAISLRGVEKVGTERERQLRCLTDVLCPKSGQVDFFKRYLNSLGLEELLNVMSFHGSATFDVRQHLLESTCLRTLCDELIDLYKVHH